MTIGAKGIKLKQLLKISGKMFLLVLVNGNEHVNTHQYEWRIQMYPCRDLNIIFFIFHFMFLFFIFVESEIKLNLILITKTSTSAKIYKNQIK